MDPEGPVAQPHPRNQNRKKSLNPKWRKRSAGLFVYLKSKGYPELPVVGQLGGKQVPVAVLQEPTVEPAGDDRMERDVAPGTSRNNHPVPSSGLGPDGGEQVDDNGPVLRGVAMEEAYSCWMLPHSESRVVSICMNRG